MTEQALRDLVLHAEAKNQRLGITGRLAFQAGSFVQVLEGERDHVGRLYSAIERDRRHADVVCLLDRMIEARSHIDWRHVLHSPATEASGVRADPRDASSGTPLARDSRNTSLAALISTPVGMAVMSTLRIQPRQARALRTVEHLLSTAETMASRDGATEFSLELVAKEANVTRQAAYRYFGGTPDLLRTLIQRRGALSVLDFVDTLETQVFEDNMQASSWVVDHLLARNLVNSDAQKLINPHLDRNNNELSAESICLMGEVLRAALMRSGILQECHSAAALAIAFAGLIASARIIVFKEGASPKSPQVRDAMIGTLLGSLRGVAAFKQKVSGARWQPEPPTNLCSPVP